MNSCTGEVVDFENYTYQDYSNLEYYERVSSLKKKAENKEIRDMKKIVQNYLLSLMCDEVKEYLTYYIAFLKARGKIIGYGCGN